MEKLEKKRKYENLQGAAEACSSILDQPAKFDRVTPLQLSRSIQAYRLEAPKILPTSLVVKRVRTKVALRESIVYTSILPHVDITQINYFGCVTDTGDSAFSWILLEDAGDVMYQRADQSHQKLAAEWLAKVHLARFNPEFIALLPDRGPLYFLSKMQKTSAHLRRILARSLLSEEGMQNISYFVQVFEKILEDRSFLESWAVSLPNTLVHCDFVPKNIRVRLGSCNSPELLVFDWEQSGYGPVSTDLVTMSISRRELKSKIDLEVYSREIAQTFPELTSNRLLENGLISRLFRLTNSISWSLWMIDHQGEIEFLDRLAKYRAWLEPSEEATFQAIRGLGS